MSGIAVVMLALFVVIIWGGLATAVVHLLRHPDETAGRLGDNPDLSSDVLQQLERL